MGARKILPQVVGACGWDLNKKIALAYILNYTKTGNLYQYPVIEGITCISN